MGVFVFSWHRLFLDPIVRWEHSPLTGKPMWMVVERHEPKVLLVRGSLAEGTRPIAVHAAIPAVGGAAAFGLGLILLVAARRPRWERALDELDVAERRARRRAAT